MTAVSYAEALYSLALEENVTEEIYSQIDSVKFAFDDNPELSKILDRPCSDKSERTAFIDRCFKDINLYLLNCIKVMSKHRATVHFSEMADEFMKLYRKENGIEIVNVITATALSDEQSEKLKIKLEKKLGKKVILSASVDPDIMGGIIVRTESSQIDASIRTRLDDIQKQIKSAVI